MKTHGSKFVRLFYKPDGSPLRRAEPKKRMSKKERLRLRRENKAAVLVPDSEEEGGGESES